MLSPSIFVYIFPELQLKNELKGGAQLDYTSLTLSSGGTYLGCCSSLPDHTITVWNWESAEPICTQPHAGQDVISLVFNPLNWLQLCALGNKSLTVWNIEKSASFYKLETYSHTVSDKMPYFDLEMPPSAISGLKGDMAESIVVLSPRLTPSAICWTPTSMLYVGCVEGFLLLVDPESRSHFSPLFHVSQESAVHCLQIKTTQINITQTWQLEGPVTTVTYSPDYETLLFLSNTVSSYMDLHVAYCT
uniref:Cilia- and flagella-associated protein 43 n=1 Tax=Cyclopterus lumpus TaxID=8103 RepID=A0A8C2Z7C1_CYCLU